ncbi:MAG: hypothetical protein COV76_00990 [Candidatus Omnitrophica bacterium CG11_big_fil_rev_8_21_14_0_20_64_10]|nr:MAG: hypothetical protein COV76_00990 [Candidatus Omnitrophica bacterium CG11_big_fil_rev_8_21_14_0_20_64_10]
MNRSLLLVGHPGPEQIGAFLRRAVEDRGGELLFLDVRRAASGSVWRERFSWRLRDRRPSRMGAFEREVLAACRSRGPGRLLAVGTAPLSRETLVQIGRLGIRRINYLTDDPWNPAHRSRWFLRALPGYDAVFSTREANLDDLRRIGVPRANHLPFAYAPEIHFPEPAVGSEPEADLLFYGGADPDRLKTIRPLIRSGFRVRLVGGYWERDAVCRPCAVGEMDGAGLRRAVAAARVVLGLVRRANRDDNSMRTFEVPAMGGCMLTEATAFHRTLFGPEGEAVLYFQGEAEMVRKLRWLLDHDADRRRLMAAARRRITEGKHTYGDRLRVMLEERV